MKSLRDSVSSAKADTAAIADKYAGKSEDELMAELKARVAEAKSDGSFSPETLKNFAAFAMPSLDKETGERLAMLIKSICEE